MIVEAFHVEEHSPPDTALCFVSTLFSPVYSSSVYLWIVCTYSPPYTAHLEWFVPILTQIPIYSSLKMVHTYVHSSVAHLENQGTTYTM